MDCAVVASRLEGMSADALRGLAARLRVHPSGNNYRVVALSPMLQ